MSRPTRGARLLWAIYLSVQLSPGILVGAQFAIVFVQEKYTPLISSTNLAGWPHNVSVELISTDGGIYSLLTKICDIHKAKSIVAVLDSSRASTSFYVETFALSRDLMYVRLANQLADARRVASNSSAFTIHHPQQALLMALRSLFIKATVAGAAILYDEQFALDQETHDFMYNVFTFHQFFKLSSNSSFDVRSILDSCRNKELLHIVLATSKDTTDRIFKQMDLHTHVQEFHFIVLRKDHSTPFCLECTKPQPVLVLEIQPPVRTPKCFFRGSTKEVYGVCALDFIAETLHAYVSSGMNTLRPAASPDCSEISDTRATQFVNFIRSRNMSTSLGVFSTINGDFELQSNVLMRHGNSTTNPLSNIAVWENANDAIVRLNPSSNASIVPPIQQVFRVITVHSPPFVFIDNKTSGTTYRGLCIDIIQSIADSMHFKIEFLQPPDGRYGGYNPNGSWNGMINELIHDRADIIAAPLSVMEERATVVDYTNPFYEPVGITILLRRPFQTQRLFRFVEVYDPKVWGLIVLALIVVSLLIGLADAFGPLGSVRNPDRDTLIPEPRQFTFLESLWFCVISMTPQGGGDLPVGFSARMLAVSWWLFGFLIISTYTANLAAFLTVSRLDTSISSLDDLAKQSKIKYATVQGTSTQEHFRRMKDIETRFYNIWKDLSLKTDQNPQQRAQLAVWEYPMSEKFTTIWNAMVNATFPSSYETGVQRVKNGDFALLQDASLNKYASQTDCDLVSIGTEMSQKAYAFAVQKGSYLKDILSQSILELNNNRFLERKRVYWWEQDKAACPKTTNVNQGIGLDSIGGVFILIPIGLFLGGISLLGENFFYRHREKKRQAAEEESNAVKSIKIHSGNGSTDDALRKTANDNPVFSIE